MSTVFTIATFNLCNLDTNAPALRFEQLGVIIARHLASPAIVAVQEIATTPVSAANVPVVADTTYHALIAAISKAGGPDYHYREIPPLASQDGGMSGANIRVGLLYDALRVTFCDRGNAASADSTSIQFDNTGPHLTLSPGRIAPHHQAFTGDEQRHWISSRKPLAAEFIVGCRPLFVIVCHLKSMRAATRRAEEYAKKQRHAQAEVIQQFAADLLDCNPQAAIVILGDFNDIPGSKTLKLLKGSQFHNLLEDHPHRYCYTRRHSGRPQALDHILISPVLRDGATVCIPHINTNSLLPDFQLASDHDPVLATIPALAESI